MIGEIGNFLLYFLLPAGPAIYVLGRYNFEWQGVLKNKTINLEVAVLTLAWTLLATLIALHWFQIQGEETALVCKSYEKELNHARLSDDRKSELLSEDWWTVCHPEDALDAKAAS